MLTLRVRRFFILLLLAALPALAASNDAASKVEAYAKKDFIAQFGESGIKGDVVKIEHFGSHFGSFFMVLTIDTNSEGRKLMYLDDDANNQSIYAYGLMEKQGKLQQIWTFKDFNSRFYKPRFYIDKSTMRDDNADGNPECIVAYFGASNQKAQPLRVITYFNGLRYAATDYYPLSKGGKVQHEYDANWKRLPKPTQLHVKNLLKSLKPLDFDALELEDMASQSSPK